MELAFWELVQNVLQSLVYGSLLVAIPILGLQAREWLAARLTAERHEIITAMAATVVMAIEQEYEKTDGQAKLARAIKQLGTQLSDVGIKLELWELTMAIEAAVFEELNRWKMEPEEGEMVEILPVME